MSLMLLVFRVALDNRTVIAIATFFFIVNISSQLVL